MSAPANNPPAPAAAAPAPAAAPAAAPAPAPVQSETKKVTTIATNTSSTEDGPWQDLRLPEIFGEILKIGCKVDCKFIVGAETDKAEIIFGHKWMFAVESPVFERMFCGDFMEAKDGTAIRLPDDDPEAFRNLRRMLYNTRSCQIEYLNFDDTISLYRLCDKYMVTSIKKLCIDHIKQFYEKITDPQLITLFAVTNELQNLGILNDVKEKLLSKKYPLIEDLNNLNIIQFVEYIQLYLANNGTSANHLDLFNTIETYLTHHQLIPQTLLEDSQNKKTPTTRLDGQVEKEIKCELLERLLACVDFGKIETDKFLAGPGISKILTWQQKYFIVSQLSTLPCEKCNKGKQEITIKVFEST